MVEPSECEYLESGLGQSADFEVSTRLDGAVLDVEEGGEAETVKGFGRGHIENDGPSSLGELGSDCIPDRATHPFVEVLRSVDDGDGTESFRCEFHDESM